MEVKSQTIIVQSIASLWDTIWNAVVCWSLIKPKVVQHPYYWELWNGFMVLQASDWYNRVSKFCFSNQQLTEKDFFINYHVRSDIKPFKPRCCHPNGLQITWMLYIKHDTYLTLLWMEKTKSFLNLTKNPLWLISLKIVKITNTDATALFKK